MAKNNMSFSVTGSFDQDSMTLREETKDAIKVFDIRKVMSKFSGYDKVKFSMSIEESDSEFLADAQDEQSEDEE